LNQFDHELPVALKDWTEETVDRTKPMQNALECIVLAARDVLLIGHFRDGPRMKAKPK